jgi:hypothetical protein
MHNTASHTLPCTNICRTAYIWPISHWCSRLIAEVFPFHLASARHCRRAEPKVTARALVWAAACGRLSFIKGTSRHVSCAIHKCKDGCYISCLRDLAYKSENSSYLYSTMVATGRFPETLRAGAAAGKAVTEVNRLRSPRVIVFFLCSLDGSRWSRSRGEPPLEYLA